MKRPPEIQQKLNTRLLPALVSLLLVMQIIFPFKGWMVFLVGLGGLWLLSYVWARSLAYNLHLKREMRFGWAHVGDRLEERFTLINTSSIPASWVEIIDHTTMPDYTASRAIGMEPLSRNNWQTAGICHQRGLYKLGPTTLRTGDPFGLYTVNIHYPDSETVTVMPPIIPLPAIEVASGGQAQAGRVRPDMLERTVSSAGVRGYIPGDSLHTIHWPTTARRGSLFVRLFDSMPSGDWRLFLDLDRQVQLGDGIHSTLEHAIILAASLADRGLRRANRAVGLMAHDQEALVWLPPERSDTQRQRILQTLATITAGPRSLAELLAASQASFTGETSLIIITAAIDKAWIEALLPLLQRGAVPTVLLLDPVSFGDTANTQPVQTLLASLGIACHIISRDLLDRPEARPGQQGQWQWRISPSGRAVAIKIPHDMSWRELR
jgi:uncharacterized protein (DUF58 family)